MVDYDYQLIKLPKIESDRGSLTFIEENEHIPFAIRRVYYIYDIPGGSERGAHAHKKLHQLLIAISGSFDVAIENHKHTETIRLDRASIGLHLKPYTWRNIVNFTTGSVCLVLASDIYDEEDYIRDYSEFKKCIAK